MKFKHGTRRRALEYEKDWVQRWKEDKTFEKSVENRSKDNSYVFYDGPPFISGNPHHGTLLSSIVKDAIPRYQTMKGKRVERVWGWDCHGLPAERFTEKKLGINSREEVFDYGLEKYIIACRNNMVQTSGEWEDVVDRIGRWVDFKGAYKTMDKDYMESVWWAFKELYDKGKIYEGEKVLMYCTLDATPLSKAEVTMDAGAYQDVTDPSVYVKFNLDDGSTLLAWTTTPWTLPANTALAVNQKLTYVEVKVSDEQFIVAKDLVGKVLQDEKHKPLEYTILRELKGKELIGKSYEPLLGVNRGENAHKVWHADYVSHEDGTGIVHLAPTYGEEDFELARKNKVPAVHTIDENGYFTESDWKDENVWHINKQIAKDLHARGIVWKVEYILHSYPHCHRCGTRLMYRAHPSWFMDIDGQREKMLEENGPITWFPAHVKNGRFAKTVEQAPDWNLSRDRFWATAMPVWKSEDGKHIKVVGSYAELKELSGIELEDYHRPWVDDITFEIDGVKYTRIDKVIDCWFESGSMPFAQFHYPFENKEKFEQNFPGNFISEYIGQVRAWFYYLHAVNVGLFGKNAFNNCIVTGNVARTAFLTTAGFPDILVLREGGKFNPTKYKDIFSRGDILMATMFGNASASSGKQTVKDATGPAKSDGSIILNLISGFPPFKFLWNNGDTTGNPINLPPGNYSLTVTNGIGCIESFDFIVGFMVGTDVGTVALTASVLPNPARDLIFLDWGLFDQFELFDQTGKRVLSRERTGSKSTISIGQLQSGQYQYQFSQNSGKQVSGKLVVTH